MKHITIINKKLTNHGVLRLVSVLVLLSFSCKKLIEVPTPTTELVTGNVFNNAASATSALTVIYTRMSTLNSGMSYNISQANGIYGDELQSASSNLTQVQLYTNALAANSSESLWSNIYNYIYNANAVISGLQQYNGISASVKNQLTGEALFLRAFFHFYLTNQFGDVPLVLTTDYSTNNTISRTSRLQVLHQVIADLQSAQSLLNSNYVDGSDTIVSLERVRPNKAVATALLARAYLYLGDYENHSQADYQKADSAATAVIANGTYGLSPLNGVFLKNSSEAIFQLQTPQPETYDTPDGNNFILLGAPSTATTATTNCTTISQQLLAAFEANDQRKSAWIGSYTTTKAPILTYYYPYKYKGNSVSYSSSGNKEYTMVLRLGEQYLIRAEARAHEGNFSGAVTDLNIIRSRAGLAGYSGPTDQASLLAAILHERQVELFAEWGHRWFDLERTGNINAVMNVVCPLKGGVWAQDGHQVLWPIPNSDRLIDNNLSQNPGY